MAWLTTGYVDNAITQPVRLAVSGSSQPVFDQFEEMARVKVRAALRNAGYPDPGATTTNEMLRLLCLGQWVLLAYGTRRGLEVPASIADAISMLELVRTGEMPIPDMEPLPRDAVGGVSATQVPQLWSADKLRGF
jgi:hypothetical protein